MAAESVKVYCIGRRKGYITPVPNCNFKNTNDLRLEEEEKKTGRDW